MSETGIGPAADAVRRRILDQIKTGALAPGERLGAERELAESFGVSRETLRAALDALQSAGLVRRVAGRAGGTFVSDQKVERDLTSLQGVPAYLRRQGFAAGTRVLATAMREPDDETRAALRLADGALVLEVIRIRLADGAPISLERAHFPADRFAGLLDHPLGGSLYELLGEVYGLVPGEAEERIEVVGATAQDARTLGVRRDAPLVSIVRIGFDAVGVPFEFSHDLFRGDRTRIVVRTRAQDGGVRPGPGAVEVYAG